MTKVKVVCEGLEESTNYRTQHSYYSQCIYEEDNFIISYWMSLDELLIENNVGCTSMEELPKYIKDIVLKEIM